MCDFFFAQLYIRDKKLFVNQYKAYINKVCDILKIIGININTVPVLDVRRNQSHNIIGSRSFSKNPTIVSIITNYLLKKVTNHSYVTFNLMFKK